MSEAAVGGPDPLDSLLGAGIPAGGLPAHVPDDHPSPSAEPPAPSGPGAPAGWYQDPARPSWIRFWNGTEWTTLATPQPPLAPPTPAIIGAGSGVAATSPEDAPDLGPEPSPGGPIPPSTTQLVLEALVLSPPTVAATSDDTDAPEWAPGPITDVPEPIWLTSREPTESHEHMEVDGFVVPADEGLPEVTVETLEVGAWGSHHAGPMVSSVHGSADASVTPDPAEPIVVGSSAEGPLDELRTEAAVGAGVGHTDDRDRAMEAVHVCPACGSPISDLDGPGQDAGDHSMAIEKRGRHLRREDAPSIEARGVPPVYTRLRVECEGGEAVTVTILDPHGSGDADAFQSPQRGLRIAATKEDGVGTICLDVALFADTDTAARS